MPANNPWVSYLDRSYEQIKASILAKLGVNNPEVTDHSESNVLIILISIFAGISEMLGYYIDNMAREAFLLTARRWISVLRISRQLDYRVKAIYPATVDITFSLKDGDDSPVNLLVNSVIPTGTIVATSTNIRFVTDSPLVIPAGQYQGTVGARQIVPVTSSNIGTGDNTPNQKYPIGINYVDSSLSLVINGINWTLVNSLGLANSTSKVFVVNIEEDGIAYAEFGDGTFGAKPGPYIIYATYYTSVGTVANSILPNTITTLVSALVLPGVNAIRVTNTLAPNGASNYEGLEDIRFRAPLSIRTLDRAVTHQDYIDVTLLAPGVGKAKIKYCCGSCIDIYILPSNGGVASLALLNTVQNFLCDRKIITTCTHVLAAGITAIPMVLEVTGKFRETTIDVEAQVRAALVSWGAFANQDINKPVRLSDIYAVVDNLSRVDFSNILDISTVPYARPQGTNTNQLNWNRLTKPTCLTRITYQLTYIGSGNFRILKEGIFMGNIAISATYSDINMELQILAGVYTLGAMWEFVLYPYGRDIVLDDYTIPFVDPDLLTITVTEVLSTLNCKPNCND